jgi:hypothetical protein
MKTLVKPLGLEEQYQTLESYSCDTRNKCDSCSGESKNNSSAEADDDILF